MGYKRAMAIAPMAALALGGCASAALHSYVGKDLGVMIARYGPPTRRIHREDGLERFEWVIASRRAAETSAPLTAFMPVKEVPLRRREFAASAGLLLGGMCVYTVFARPEPATGGWTIVSYLQPRLDCN